jgi:hypothetical protein
MPEIKLRLTDTTFHKSLKNSIRIKWRHYVLYEIPSKSVKNRASEAGLGSD